MLVGVPEGFSAFRSKLLGSQGHFWEGRGVGFVIHAGEGKNAFIMKLLPIDLSGLKEFAHLLTGPMEPRLEGAQQRRHPQIEEGRRMAILAGRSLEGFELLQVPLSHDLGEEVVGLADPGLQRLDPGFGAVCLGVDRCHTRMLAELGGPDPFEAEQVELEGPPRSSRSSVSMTCRMPCGPWRRRRHMEPTPKIGNPERSGMRSRQRT